MTEYYILYNGQQVGPMSKDMLLNYGLNPNSQIWAEGMPQWVAAYTVPELMEVINRNSQAHGFSHQPPQQPSSGPDSYDNTGTSGKSRLVAGLLAILLGGLGIQYFYMGKVGAGIITILLTIVTCGLWEILTLIQGILILLMTQDKFEQKYIYTTSAFPLF